MNRWLAVICVALMGIASSTHAATAKPICAKNPRIAGDCFWTKAVYGESADSGDVITLQESGTYIVESAPEAIQKLQYPGGSSAGPLRYIVGDYLFCPLAPRIHPSADPQVFDWRYYGCVEDFKNATLVSYADKELERKICGLVDCSRPGFSDFQRTATSVAGSNGEVTTYIVVPPPLPKTRCMLGFRVEITNGIVEDVTGLFARLAVSVGNSRSWGNDPDNRTIINGDVQTSILSAEELADVHFRIVKGEPRNGDFDMRGFVRTFDCSDLENPREVELGPSNFKIVKASR